MTLAFLALATILVLAIKGFNSPFTAVLAFVIAYELQPGELYPALAPLHIERVLVFFALLVMWKNGKPFRLPPISKTLLWFYGAMLLSTLFAFWRLNSIQFDLAFFEIIFYHFLLVSVLDSEERIRKYILVSTGLVAWIGVSALYEYHQGVRQFTMNIERAEGLTSAGGDPNSMAITMVIAMPAALLLLGKGTSKWIKLYGMTLFAVYLITIIDTGSRTAFLAFLLFLFITVFRRRTNWKYIPLVLIGLPLLWIVIPQQYKARYETVTTRDQDESYTNRLLSWQGGVRMFLHNPIIGIGPDDYTTANGVQYWPGEPRHWLNAHSLYFKLLGELGLVGIFTFFAYVVGIIRTNSYIAQRLSEQFVDPVVQRFPAACSLSLYLLLFTGYSAHNTYRTNWYTLGAVSAAIALLKPPNRASAAPVPAKPTRLPAWIPARQSPSPVTATAEFQQKGAPGTGLYRARVR